MGRLPDDPPEEMLLQVIPYEYASQIAYIISSWALLEHEIDGLICDLAGLYDSPRIGACLTAQYSTAAHRFNALISLARVRGVPEFEVAKLNKFKEYALALAERRNRVAHDPWLTSYNYKNLGPERQGKTYRLQKTARSKLEYDYKPITVEELTRLKEEILEAIDKFREIKLNPTIDTWNA